MRFYGLGMSDFSIRAAVAADAPIILGLLKELAIYEKAPYFQLSESAVRRDMLGGACHCDLAFHGDREAGIVTWFWTYKSFRAVRYLFVEDVYVRPEFRGHGLGRQLLAHLAGRARQANGFLEWRVLDWNAPAVEFYKNLGATLLPEWITCRLEGDALERLAS
jgi:GNAT superfamily N-acetyltransferase